MVSRFSLPPNSLGHCGSNEAPQKFIDCVVNGECSDIGDEISKFITLNPYLKTISEITGLPKFSYEVVEAYWLGNDLVKNVKVEHYKILLKNFRDQGVPVHLIDKFEEEVPGKFIPTHFFQVLRSRSIGKESFLSLGIERFNDCMIRWGEVLHVDKQKIVANLNSLEEREGRLELTKKESNVFQIPGFLTGLKVGNIIAVHWGQGVKILDNEEAAKISFWTSKVLDGFEFP